MSRDPRRGILRQAITAAALVALSLPAVAQEPSPASIPDKWRPKDGVYAAPGRDFKSDCNETNNMTIALGDKSVGGYEWSCDVKQFLDLAPDSLKLEMTCSDYNLAQNLDPREGKWESRVFKEVMLIKRLDAKTISIQKSLNGKLKDPPWRAAYCPAETQRLYTEAKLQAKEEAKQKAEEAKRKAEEEKTLKSAHPRDGVYAAVGASFDERCSNFNDTVVAFATKSIVTASNRCEIYHERVQLPDTVRIGAACTLQPASSPDAVSVQDTDTTPDRENLMFKKIDDKTVILWIINNGHFTGDGRTLSYCNDQVQRAHATQRRTSKPIKN